MVFVAFALSAWAAIKTNGSVVTWGHGCAGGDSGLVKDLIRDVKSICGNPFAFAAITQGGSVVTWGMQAFGGDSFAVQNKFKNVTKVVGCATCFAALNASGSVVTWGNLELDDSVAAQISSDVVELY